MTLERRAVRCMPSISASRALEVPILPKQRLLPKLQFPHHNLEARLLAHGLHEWVEFFRLPMSLRIVLRTRIRPTITAWVDCKPLRCRDWSNAMVPLYTLLNGLCSQKRSRNKSTVARSGRSTWSLAGPSFTSTNPWWSMRKLQTHTTNRFISAVLFARWSSMNCAHEISPEAISTGGKFFVAGEGAAHVWPPFGHSNTPAVRQEIRVGHPLLFTFCNAPHQVTGCGGFEPKPSTRCALPRSCWWRTASTRWAGSSEVLCGELF